MLNFGKPARLGIASGAGDADTLRPSCVPEWSLSSLLVVRVSPMRTSLISIGEKTRVSATP